ncbi:MAG: protein translocase subunit SecF [Candidatus Moranbacteria bacterium]|nr:protein translocase subunit SecF [Candidatus Moranbacteria bacterium]
MMQIINKRKYTYAISGILVACSIFLLSIWGLRLGIDFKGGTLMEISFSQEDSQGNEVTLPSNIQISNSLSEIGLKELVIQPSENRTFILRYVASDENTNEKVLEKLKELDENVSQERVDFIGASVSSQIKKNAFFATILAIIGIALYIAWAFRKVSQPVHSMEYGVGAILALTHDVLITLGIFAVLGKFFEIEVGVSFIAALLTILGYSVNDTIVVYDRIRENIIKSSKKINFEDIVNKSLNETLTRSINTSLTVVIVLVSIVLFGGESIKYFSIALLVGVIFGTYSSIFVASALLVSSYEYKKKHK